MAPKKKYSPFQMAHAIEAVKKGEKIATAAKKYGVPRITLHDKITGKTPAVCSMGPKTYLSVQEEAVLERWIVEMAEKHIPITKDELLDSVQKIIIDQNRTTPFTDNRPGKKWYQLFLNRHPALSERTAQNLTTARDAVTEEGIRCWFQEVENYLREKNLLDILQEPNRMYNTDESAFYLAPKAGKVLAKKGDKHVYQSSGDDKENLTVLITGNAAGQLAPPMVVYSYERIPSAISAQFPEDWAIGRSPSGWMCGSTFYEYIANIFHPWLVQNSIKKPVLFFLDGHKSHLTLHLSNFCTENGIEIIALHPNSTHILQPMDLAVFRPLKTFWRKAVKDWKLQHLGQNLRKESFAPVLKIALGSITEDSVKNGFRAGGLFPFGPDYIDLTKIKSRKKPEDSTELKTFFDYFEKEILKKFGREKLQCFNELFFKNREELNSRLNEEDTSLYIIWASNKQAVERLVIDRSPMQAEVDMTEADVSNQAELQDHNYANLVLSDETAESDNSTSILPDLAGGHALEGTTNDASTKQSHLSITDTVPVTLTSTPLTLVITECMSSKGMTRAESKEKPEDTLNVEGPLQLASSPLNSTVIPTENTVAEITSSKKTIAPESKEESNEALINDQPSTSKQAIDSLQLASTYSVCAHNTTEKTPLKDTTNSTSKSFAKKIGNTYIPSPFKRVLFWPGEDDDKKGKKRRLNEKIPCAITSTLWKDYHEKKEEEKKEKERQKEIKAREKEEKRQLKEKEKENKKQKRLKDKEIKKKKQNKKPNPKPMDTSSDDTDTEMNFAESEDSYNVDDEEVISDISESDNIPLSKVSKTGKTYFRGEYVIIKYEGEFFPGVIRNACGNNFEISTMTFSVGNTFKWPEKEDKIWYQKSDIVQAISKPVLCNKRGFYTIPEMKKYLPFAI